MTATDAADSLAVLTQGLDRLQKSARNSVPMFLLGILATLIAAGVALYYIITLSAALREAQAGLQQSQRTLAQANADLAAVKASLQESQQSPSSADEARSIATAISDVSRSQVNIATASTRIRAAEANLPQETSKYRAAESTARAMSRAPAPLQASEFTERFEVVETDDKFLSLRVQPSMATTELAKLPTGTLVLCGKAFRNASGNLWRPCKDDSGQVGFVSNKFIRKAGPT